MRDRGRLLGHADGAQPLVRSGGLVPVVLDSRRCGPGASAPARGHRCPCRRARGTAFRRGRTDRRESSHVPVRYSAASRWCCVETGARHDVLVHADGPVDLAAAPVQAAERKVRVDRFVIELGEAEEHFERAIGLVVEQEPHALEITLRGVAWRRLRRDQRAPCRDAPADGERACQRPARTSAATSAAASAGGSVLVDGSRHGAPVGRAGVPAEPQARWRSRPRSASNSATQRERPNAPASRPGAERDQQGKTRARPRTCRTRCRRRTAAGSAR